MLLCGCHKLGGGDLISSPKPAYIGSWALIAADMRSIPKLAEPLCYALADAPDLAPDDATPPVLPDCIQEAIAVHSELNSKRPEADQLPSFTLDPSSNTRKQMQKKASLRVYQQLRTSLDDNATPDELCRTDHCSEYGSGHFLNAFPCGSFRTSYFDISDGAFLAACQERLGLPVLGAGPAVSCALCHCNFVHGIAHGHVCPKLPKGECGSLVRGIGHGAGVRHKRLQNEFIRMLNNVGLAWDADQNGANQRVFLPSGNKVDCIIRGLGEGGRPLALDFRIAYPLQRNAEQGTFAAQEKAKDDKYKDECDQQGWDFSPFVLDTFGGFGPAARSVFRRLIKHSEKLNARDQWKHSWSASSFSTHWLQRFSLVIARANYEMHRAVIPTAPLLEPVDFQLA